MKLAILTTKEIYETRQLAEEMKRRGHHCELISPPPHPLTSHAEAEPLKALSSFDAVYYRTGLVQSEVPSYMELLHKRGLWIINPGTMTFPLRRNKLFQTSLVIDLGIEVPITVPARKGVSFDAVTELLSVPFIAKPSLGICGRDVALIRDSDDFEHLPLEKEEYLFQEYIEHTEDYRVFVVGEKAQVVMKRTAPEGSFKTNISRGGTGEPVDNEAIRTTVIPLAERAAHAFQMDIAGVDIILRAGSGAPVFIEINETVGWKGIETFTDVAITSLIADWLETEAPRRKGVA